MDIIPEKAEYSRRRLFERAMEEKALVFTFHFTFPGLGHIVKEGMAWKWEPYK